jgi:MFS family permease
VTSDRDRILAAQAVRAFAYGMGAVVLGTSLAARGWSTTRVGALLGCVLAGTILTSVLVATRGDRIGRRRLYAALFIALGLTGAVFASTDRFWLLAVVSLLGALSTEVVESGPFTSLEQPLLAERTGGHARTRTFGTYNAIAAIAGSLGALAASGSSLIAGGSQTLFWSFVPRRPARRRDRRVALPGGRAGRSGAGERATTDTVAAAGARPVGTVRRRLFRRWVRRPEFHRLLPC